MRKQWPCDQCYNRLKYSAHSESPPELVRRKWTLVTGMEMKARRNRKIIRDLQDSSAIRDISHTTINLSELQKMSGKKPHSWLTKPPQTGANHKLSKTLKLVNSFPMLFHELCMNPGRREFSYPEAVQEVLRHWTVFEKWDSQEIVRIEQWQQTIYCRICISERTCFPCLLTMIWQVQTVLKQDNLILN